MVVDIIVGAIVIISAVISFLRGFMREILTIAGVAGGAVASYYMGSTLTPTFRNWFGITDETEPKKLFDLIPMDMLASVCAYVAIFIGVVIFISIISHFVAGAVRTMGLGPIDRTLGVIFGIVRAVILLGLAYTPFHIYMNTDSKTEIFADSKTHFVIEKTAKVITKFLPESETMEKKINDATEKGEESIKKKLLENEFLDDGSKKEEKKPEEKQEEGYKEEQREELNDLFTQPETKQPYYQE